MGTHTDPNTGHTQTLVEHWDGTAWSVVPSPNLGVAENYLTGVTAVAGNDVWAVGNYVNAAVNDQTLVEHWDGSNWSVVPSPNVVGTTDNQLTKVSARAGNDVWAVGDFDNYDRTLKSTLVEHWDGSAWSVVPSPNVGTDNNRLFGVAAVAGNDVWAVGFYVTGSLFQTLAEHWNGTAWAVVPSPNVGISITQLFGVAAVAGNDVWAVGDSASNAYDDVTLVEHWDGGAWSVVPSPNAGNGGGELTAVAARAGNDVWAVGDGNQQTLVEHWNGSAWSIVPSAKSRQVLVNGEPMW